jgi:hypothetical protein
MTIEQLREAHKATPFRPFTVHLADGRAYDVPHSDFLSYSPHGGRTIIVYGEGESFSIIDLLLVTGLAVHATAAANGFTILGQLRAAYNARPFQPFALHLTDGRTIEVAQWEFMSFAPSGRRIIVHQSDESFEQVDLRLVKELAVHATTPANGQ